MKQIILTTISGLVLIFLSVSGRHVPIISWGDTPPFFLFLCGAEKRACRCMTLEMCGGGAFEDSRAQSAVNELNLDFLVTNQLFMPSKRDISRLERRRPAPSRFSANSVLRCTLPF